METVDFGGVSFTHTDIESCGEVQYMLEKGCWGAISSGEKIRKARPFVLVSKQRVAL
jgi:hypothetical protein